MNLDAALARFEELRVKGFLGPTLKEDPRLEDLGTRAARAAGIEVEGGKLRCPDETPGAGRFTDMQMSNCRIPLTDAELSKNSVAKKAVPLTQGTVEFKAGLFHSSGRIGRLVQAAGTAILPGDVSNVRHPVRSHELAAVTPGRIGLRGGIGKPRMIRCPAGYEHGGRFSPADLSGCGRQLFTNEPSGSRSSGRAARAGQQAVRTSRRNRFDSDLVGLNEGESAPLRGRRAGRAVQISRQADIKPVGSTNSSKRRSAIARALEALRAKGSGNLLVRRDGSTLASIKKITDLHNVRMNRDLDGATWVTKGKLRGLGREEIPMLLNNDIHSVAWALPGGDSIEASKTRELSVADQRRLGRAWKVGMTLIDLEAASHGAIKIEAKIKKAASTERIWIEPIDGEGAARSVPRWVFEMFLAEEAEGRIGRAWKVREES